ncbi:hypothetical protein GF336_03385 [Candidatus Woesearchaeota archaeon]|nr:hypothetical protein [Candidatus Woesearchaeota archaeon]
MKKRDNNQFITPPSSLKRVLAYVIDFLILNFIILLPLDMLIKADSIEEIARIASTSSESISLILISITASIITVLYFTYFEYKLQQTPGKILTRQFLSEPKPFSKIFFSNLSMLILFLFIFDLAYMIVSPTQQRFMEKITNIQVVESHEA